MDGDPYSRLVAVVRGENSEQSKTGETESAGLGAAPVKMRLGTVSSGKPLKVKVAGVEMPTEVLRINERLAKNAKWKVKITSDNADYKKLTGTLSGGLELGTVTDGDLHSDDTVIDKASVLQLEVDLEVGDQVLLLTEDDQSFIVAMKVVDAV